MSLPLTYNCRVEGTSRGEYLECLKRDLCAYYNYNDYMMEKLMAMFPVAEIVDVLEANEVQRPVTIRYGNWRHNHLVFA